MPMEVDCHMVEVSPRSKRNEKLRCFEYADYQRYFATLLFFHQLCCLVHGLGKGYGLDI